MPLAAIEAVAGQVGVVERELIADLKRVAGKPALLFKLAAASLTKPDGTARDVVFPAVNEQILRDLVAEGENTGPAYRRHLQTVIKLVPLPLPPHAAAGAGRAPLPVQQPGAPARARRPWRDRPSRRAQDARRSGSRVLTVTATRTRTCRRLQRAPCRALRHAQAAARCAGFHQARAGGDGGGARDSGRWLGHEPTRSHPQAWWRPHCGVAAGTPARTGCSTCWRADLRIGVTDALRTVTEHENLPRSVLQEHLLLCLNGVGTNTGLKRMASGQQDVSYKDLRYIRRRFINRDGLREPSPPS